MDCRQGSDNLVNGRTLIMDEKDLRKMQNSISNLGTVRESICQCRVVLNRNDAVAEVRDVLRNDCMLLDKVLCDLSGVLLSG